MTPMMTQNMMVSSESASTRTRQRRATRQMTRPAKNEAQHVGDAVPAHGERAEREQDGIDGLVDVVEHVVPSQPARHGHSVVVRTA